MGKRRQYTDEFRASAIVMLESQGYPDEPGALVSVASHLGIPHQTLSRWAKEAQNPAPPELVHEKTVDMCEMLRAEIRAALQAAPDAREFANYKDLITAVGIMLDKLQLLEGRPTAITQDTVTIDDRRETILRRLSQLADARGQGAVH